MGDKKGTDHGTASVPFVEQELFGPWDFDPTPGQFDLHLKNEIMKERRRRGGKRQLIKVKLGGSRL